MKVLIWNRLKETLHRFDRDQSGLALIYVTVALPVIIGMGLLAIDVGRLWSLQSSLQHGADALALAGAGELDRRPDAITRANRAVATLVTTNANLFGTSVVTIDEDAVSLLYVKTLPLNDVSAITDYTTDPVQAHYIQVLVKPSVGNFNTIFPATFLGASSNAANATAMAVAGMDQAVCNFTPVFMCNPLEPVGSLPDPSKVYNDYGLLDYVKTIANRRRLIELKSQNEQYSPGNFGFLAVAGPATPDLALSIASTAPNACFILNGLTTKTGNIDVLKKAFNVRFDLYENGAVPGGNGKWTDYPPALNVRKGYTFTAQNNACSPSVANSTDALGFPRDSCFAANKCSLGNGRIGGGDWDFDSYWNVNFFGQPKPKDSNGLDYSNSNRPARYDIYKYENTHNPDVNGIGALLKVKSHGPTKLPEVGLPQCQVGKGVTSTDRRIIYAAIVNCGASGLSGGKRSGLNAVAFAKFFMTNPMVKDTNNDTVLSTEIVDVVLPGDSSGVARDMVQLYR